tara:strand:- start:124 stop:468 length:345 start_codon:yes stop_codon:yes gene_type:complete
MNELIHYLDSEIKALEPALDRLSKEVESLRGLLVRSVSAEATQDELYALDAVKCEAFSVVKGLRNPSGRFGHVAPIQPNPWLAKYEALMGERRNVAERLYSAYLSLGLLTTEQE